MANIMQDTHADVWCGKDTSQEQLCLSVSDALHDAYDVAGLSKDDFIVVDVDGVGN